MHPHIHSVPSFPQASLGIANLIVMAMEEEGLSEEEARSKIWLVDSRGLIVKDRPKGGINGHKQSFAHPHEPMENLEEIVRELKPTTLIGEFVGMPHCWLLTFVSLIKLCCWMLMERFE